MTQSFARRLTTAGLAAAGLAIAGPGPVSGVSALRAQDSVTDSASTFVVLGHVRGDRDLSTHYLIDEIVSRVTEADPDFVVLTGDLIWGGVQLDSVDRAGIEGQWDALDAHLDSLDVPIFRVPGNHDIQSALTDSVFQERYGPVPRVVVQSGVRLVLLDSAWPDQRTRGLRGFYPDSAQTRMLSELEPGPPTFVFLHHLFWWEHDDSPWWRTFHPLLREAGVRAVFGGDYGPTKFSHETRDGIDYFQTAVTPDPQIGIFQSHEWNRLLGQQFDNFIVVRRQAGDWTFEIETIGAVASGHFTPDRWWEIHGTFTRPPPPSGRDHLSALWAVPRGKLFLLGAAAGLLLAGFVIGYLLRWLAKR